MVALEITNSDVKNFMGQLLRQDIFDQFEVRSIEIATAMRMSIDGLVLSDDPEATASFSTWEALRPLVYEIIKSSTKPKYVKIVFSYKASAVGEIHPNAAALFLNLSYENDGVTFTTGTGQKEFLFDKSLDSNWDEWIRGFFVKVGLAVVDRMQEE